VATWLPTEAAAPASAPVTVTVTSNPASGGSVAPGATVTYTLSAQPLQPLPQGATVVDDLSGLLSHATIATPATQLASEGLALDPTAMTLTWTLPVVAASVTASAATPVQFQVTVAPDAPSGAALTTAASPQGGTCSAGDPCATTLTVTDPAGSTAASAPAGPPAGPPAPAATPAAPASTTATTTTTTPPVRRPALAAPAAADPPCTEPQASNASVVPPPPAPDGFEIDGNLCVNTEGNLDWSNVPAVIEDDGFNDATQFTQGASENSWPWSTGQISGNGTAPAADDIGHVYAYTQVVNDQVYAYFAFERAASTGNTAFWVELNTEPNLFGPVPNRTTGDLRLTFYQQSGSQPLALAMAQRWTSTSATTGSWGPSLPINGGTYAAAVNPGNVTNLAGQTLTAGTFAEAAVNLSDLFPAGTCSGNYGVLNIRSSASTNENASLADWVEPLSLNVPSTCASVRVDKVWDIDGTTFANGDQPTGFDATPTLTGRASPEFGVEYTTQDDGTEYEVGQSVTVGETVAPLPPGCTNNPTGDSGTHVLTPGLNEFTITNVVTCTHLTLVKTVIGGSATPADWTLTAAGPSGFSGAGESEEVTAVPVEPGAYVLSEVGPSHYVQTDLACTGATLDAATSTVTVAQGDNAVCTFTNTAEYPVVLTKTWVNAITGDTVGLAITDGTNTGTGSSTAPATTTDATLTTLAGDTVGLSETFTTGTAANYTSTLECDNDVTPVTTPPGTSGSFDVPGSLEAGTTITCTFTNTRNEARVILQKTWINGAFDDTALMTINGSDPTISGTATSVSLGRAGAFTDPLRHAISTVYAGQTVNLDEVLGTANTGTYDSSIACDNPAVTLSTTAGTSSSFEVPNTLPADTTITCTFTNTRTEATLILRKAWVNAIANDQSQMSISGTDPGTVGSATSIATGGTETDNTNTAEATIFSGESVEVSEFLPDSNAGSYDSTLDCTPPTGLTVAEGGQAGTIEVPATPVGVSCTFTNSLTTAGILTLRKEWVNGAEGDSANLTAAGALDTGTATAVVPDTSTGPSENEVRIPITPNEGVSLSEVFGTNTGTYDAGLACDTAGLTGVAADGTSGTFNVTSTTPANVTCTFTNTRTASTVTLQKTWVNAAGGDQAGLSISGTNDATTLAPNASFTSTATGASGSETDPTVATAPIFSGDTITLDEVLPPGLHNNLGTYDPSLSCVAGGTTIVTAPDTTGSFDVPAAPVPVVCMFTNTRTSAMLVLQKTWFNGAVNDSTELAISGSEPTIADTATSVATGATGAETDTANQATTPIFSGQTVNLEETLGVSNTGTYTSALTCDNNINPITTGSPTSGTFDVPDTVSPTTIITCTFTNTRNEGMLVLQKEWINGAAGDTADLAISGTDPTIADTATSTATGATGAEIDVTNVASTPIFSGQTVNLDETLGLSNTGIYTSALTCDNNINPITTGGGTSGAFDVPGILPTMPITCTFTNSRRPVTVNLTKTWINPITGDSVALNITDGIRNAAGSSIAPGPGQTFDASLDAFAGDTITLSETFDSGTLANYTPTLECDNGITPTTTGNGTTGFFVVPGTLPLDQTIVCTFTNTRHEAEVTLNKAWVNGAAGDTAGLSIVGTDLQTGESPTSTATSTATGGTETDTTNVASAPIFGGETVTLNEDLPALGDPPNTGAYTSTIVCTPDTGFTEGEGGQGGTLVVPSAPVDVACTITNTRVTSVLTLQKQWVNAWPTDSAVLAVTGEAGTSTATADVPGTGTGVSANKVVEFPIGSGETLDLAETLNSANIDSYVSTLTCDQPGLSGVADDGQSGTFTVPPNTAAVTCTFTNTAPAPDPLVTKTVTSNIQNPDGTWTTVYNVAAVNPDPLRPTLFTLTDTLAFGANITVNTASVTGPGASPSWNGITDTTVVANAVLGAGTTENYTVTVNSTVHAEASADDRNCAAGGGFLNHAAITFPPAGTASLDPTASACADPGSPTVTKTVVSVAPGAPAGHWTVTYAVTVTNGTDTQLSYSLNDPLGFPAGVTVTSSSASKVTSALDGSGASAPQAVPGWTGSGAGTALATNQTLAAMSKDTYTLVVGVTVSSSVSAGALGCSAAGGGPGHGFFNAATMTSGGDTFNAQACANITPTPPAPTPEPPPARLASTGPLPFTGMILSHYLLVAALLLGAGTTLVVGSRRRRLRGRHARRG